jgi:transposase
MHHDAIPVRLAIEGFRVIASHEREDSLEIVIETETPPRTCPHCRHDVVRAKERKQLWVRDVMLRPAKQTWLLWLKRRFRCALCSKTFTETHQEIPPRATHTRRFDLYLGVVAIRTPYAWVAEEQGVTFYRIDVAARRLATGLLEDRFKDPPTRLCIDEQSHRRGGIFNTVISDPDRHRVLELVQTRSKRAVRAFLKGLSKETKAAIKEVCIDMYDPYRVAIRAALPHAAVVVDPFHVQRLGSKAVDRVRRELQRRRGDITWDHPRWNRPLFHVRHKLLRGPKRLRVKDLDDLAEAFTVHPQLHTAWELMWELRRVYDACDRAEAKRRLDHWHEHVANSEIAAFKPSSNDIRFWEEEILAHFDSGLTNAYAEGITNKIKVIKRNGYGFRSFANFRRRVLMACG